MSSLPLALQPWRPWLACFDHDLALTLGALLLRLRPVLGRHATPLQQGEWTPDGVDDLRKRGSYERLLLSEWVLAEELPDEFLRRAAQQEHLFLAPRMVAPRSKGLIVLICDCGPLQWGVPRLLHIALWILLARRAEEAGVPLQWGVAQRPGELHAVDAAAALQGLLQARTAELCTPSQQQAWSSALAALQPGEVWWLGDAPDWLAMPGITHQMLSRCAWGGMLQLRLRLRSVERSLTLPVPDVAQCARLLSGDFLRRAEDGARLRGTAPLALQQPPLFSNDGLHLAVAVRDEHCALVYSLTRRNQVSPPRRAQWSAGGELMAAALVRKEFVGLVVDHGHLYFWRMQGFAAQPRPDHATMALVPGRSRWLQAALVHAGHGQHRFAMIDCEGRLHSWTSHSARARMAADPVVEHVLRLQDVDGQVLVYAQRVEQVLRLMLRSQQGGALLQFECPCQIQPVAVHLCGTMGGRRWRGALAWAEQLGQPGAPGPLRVHIAQRFGATLTQHQTFIDAGQRWLGLIVDPERPGQAQLLTLARDQRTLMAVGEHGSVTLYQAPAEVHGASVSADGLRIALIDEERRLTVLGEYGRRVLLNVESADD